MHSCQYAFLLLKAGMNISFGCFDRTMTENLFYFVNISALFPKISGEREPEHVGSIMGCIRGGITANNSPDGLF